MLLFRSLVVVALLCSSPALWGITDPTDVAGLVLWTDAQDVNGNGVQPANGATVNNWVDKSGNGHNLSTAAGTVTYEPTGFDATNPGLRFPRVARMAGANPFAGIRQNEITLFVVNANVSLTNNFSVNLNGVQTSSSSTNGRFSLHTPWTNRNLYFDAGACCGSTRLYGSNPNATTDTALYTALSDQPGSRQWLRIDGQPFRSDNTGINANVSGGIHLGDLPGSHSYNGRFAEFVLYDRALSLVETEAVECYLMLKWKPADAPARCSIDFSDAPASYGNPSHLIDLNIRLGTTVTDETTGYNDANAAGDVDDGVNIPTLPLGQSATIIVNVAGTGARLNAWIDWDGNGSFDTLTEQIASNMQDPGGGVISIPVAVPAGAVTSQTFARFRWSTDLSTNAVNDVSDGEVEDYAVNVVALLSGAIFLDNGAATGIAHNSLIDGGESSGQYATLSIIETASGTEIATATVDVSGNWSASLPPHFTGEIELVASPMEGYLFVSESTSNLPGPTNLSQIDGAYTSTLTTEASYTGLNFGLIQKPTLTHSQHSTIAPGYLVDLAHIYVAGSTADVDFVLVDQVPLNGFTTTLFIDNNCDGSPDSVLNSPLNVTVDQVVCLIVRTHANSDLGGDINNGYGIHSYAITAQSHFTDSTQESYLRNDDKIELNSSQLTLEKSVRNITASGLESSANTGEIGDILEYRIVLRNLGNTPVSDVTVNDATPVYTTLAAPISSPVAVANGLDCTVVIPLSNVTGYAGPIEWSCPGTFSPGDHGAISFQVEIQP